jgi:hypothetical protein
MKTFLFALAIIISATASGMKKFTIPKNEFEQQFTGGLKSEKVYCYKEDGSKVWLFSRSNSIITFKLQGDAKKEFILRTVKLSNGGIEGVLYDIWGFSKKTGTIKFADVQAIYIERKTEESVMRYVNTDSSRLVARQKNDSLQPVYLAREENMITWCAADTFLIRENACYHLTFADNTRTEFGVVQRITQDSIYISTAFSPQWAKANKKEYRIAGILISEITQLHLLRSGGYSYKIAKAADYRVTVSAAQKEKLSWPCWYAGTGAGNVVLYRAWLTGKGFVGIMEENGKVFWYEGN